VQAPRTGRSDKPTIALVAFVENGGFGAAAAAPIARKVMDAYFDAATLDAALKIPGAPNNASAGGASDVRRAR
jgi:penicillin-binding protein 2